MKRTCEITVTFTAQEKANLAAAAKKRGLNLSDFIRALVVLGGAKPSPEDVLLRFGVAHRTLQLIYDDLSNRPGPVDPELLQALRVTLPSIEESSRILTRELP